MFKEVYYHCGESDCTKSVQNVPDTVIAVSVRGNETLYVHSDGTKELYESFSTGDDLPTVWGTGEPYPSWLTKAMEDK